VTGDTAPVRLLRLPAVLDRVGLGRSAWYVLIGAGLAPQPVHLGQRCVAWPEAEVDEWIAARIAERGAPTTEARGS
jgi:prophage regulatory protein